MVLSSLSKSLQKELDKMVSNMEGHLSDVDRNAGVEHMNETHELKLSMLRSFSLTLLLTSAQATIYYDKVRHLLIVRDGTNIVLLRSQRLYFPAKKQCSASGSQQYCHHGQIN